MEEMPGKLTKNRKIREGQRLHAKKVLASVDEVLTEYDGSRSAKDRITRLSITLNEKLVTLKHSMNLFCLQSKMAILKAKLRSLKMSAGKFTKRW